MADVIKYVSLSNLTKYDEKIKAHIASADATLKENLEGQVEVVAGALDSEITRAKAAEAANAAAAQAAQTHSETLAGKVGAVPDGSTVMGIINNIQENAYDDSEIRGLISDLDTNKADKTQVATDIADAVKAETDARVEAVTGVQGAVDTLSQTHATDKKTLEDAIALKADQTDLESVSAVANAAVKQSDYDTKVEALEAKDGELADAIDVVDGKVDVLIGEDANKSVRTIANEELAKQLIAEGADESLDTLQEIAAWIQSHPDDASAMNAAIIALQNKVDTGDKTVSTYVTDAIDALSIGDYAKAADLTALAGRVQTLETNSATKTEVEAVSTSLTEYKDAHKDDYTNSQIDAKIKVNADAIAALGDTYATDTELAQAIESEVTRSNNAYAAKSLETTVADHKNDTVSHVTADERTAWNKVADKADQTALQSEIDRATAKEAELLTAIEAFEECTTEEINALFTA